MRWGIKKIRQYEISIESLLLIIPEIEIISELKQIRCSRSVSVKLKGGNDAYEVCDDQFLKLSRKIGKLLSIEQEKASERCHFEEISAG